MFYEPVRDPAIANYRLSQDLAIANYRLRTTKMRGFKPRLRGLCAGCDVLRMGQDQAILTYSSYKARLRGLCAGCDGLRTCSRLGDRELQMLARLQSAPTGFARGL